jgi:hypothetical protein
VVTISQKKLKSKTDYRGLLAFYLGLAKDYGPSSVRVFNIKTQKVLISRDVKFMDNTYNSYFQDNNTTNRYQALQDDDSN